MLQSPVSRLHWVRAALLQTLSPRKMVLHLNYCYCCCCPRSKPHVAYRSDRRIVARRRFLTPIGFALLCRSTCLSCLPALGSACSCNASSLCACIRPTYSDNNAELAAIRLPWSALDHVVLSLTLVHCYPDAGPAVDPCALPLPPYNLLPRYSR